MSRKSKFCPKCGKVLKGPTKLTFCYYCYSCEKMYDYNTVQRNSITKHIL